MYDNESKSPFWTTYCVSILIYVLPCNGSQGPQRQLFA